LALAAQAVARDSHFAQALALSAWCYFWRVIMGWSSDPTTDSIEGVRLARAALAADYEDPNVLAWSGQVLSYLGREYDAAGLILDRALRLNPNSSLAYAVSGWIRLYASETDTAVECFEQSLRLNPFDAVSAATSKTGIAYAYLSRSRAAEAIGWAREAAQEFPNFIAGTTALAAALALAGRVEEARAAAAAVLRVRPDFRIGLWEEKSNFKDPGFLAPLYVGLRQAGLPE